MMHTLMACVETVIEPPVAMNVEHKSPEELRTAMESFFVKGKVAGGFW